jgi:hypothetical protein
VYKPTLSGCLTVAVAVAIAGAAGKNRSQLSVIFDVIGTPQLDDLPHLDENTAALLSNLAPRTPQVCTMYCICHGLGSIRVYSLCC